MFATCGLWTPDGPCVGKVCEVNPKLYVARRCDKCGCHSYKHLSLEQLLEHQKFNLDLQDEYLERVDAEAGGAPRALMHMALCATGVALNKRKVDAEIEVKRQEIIDDKEETVMYFRKAVDVLCVVPGATDARACNLRKIAVLKELRGYDISEKVGPLFRCELPAVVKKLAGWSTGDACEDQEVVVARITEATELVDMWREVIRENKLKMKTICIVDMEIYAKRQKMVADKAADVLAEGAARAP